MTKKIILSIVLVILIIGAMFSNRLNKEEKSIHQTYFYLGTIIDITLFGTDDTSDLEPITQLINRYDLMFDRHTETSDIYRLNESKSLEVNPETYEVIETSLFYSNLSNGKFDITINPIVDLWQIGTESAGIPSQEAIDHALETVSYQNIELKDNYEVTLNNNTSIDLGAIAKGFIADKIVETLKEEGIERALINLGGNVFALGQPTDAAAWRIGIKNPKLDQSSVLLALSLTDKSVVTSGITERYFLEDDVLYHHIFDPATGYPLNNDILSITVVTDTSLQGDALSTSLYALGIDQAFETIQTLDNVSIIIVTKNNEIMASKDIYSSIDLLDDSFTLKEK